MRRLSIKLRVTLWYTLLMGVLAVICLMLILGVSEQRIRSDSQQQLIEAVADCLKDIDYDDDDRRVELDDDSDYYRDGIYLAVYGSSGELLGGRLPSAYSGGSVLSAGELQTAEVNGETWYCYDSTRSLEGYGQVWVRGVMTSGTTAQAFTMLHRVALIVLPGIILLAAVGGYWITRSAFRPVQQITEAAERIGSGRDLSLRIGLPEGRDEIHTLAATFDRMFDRLEEAFENEKQFTSDASHELRTPVTVIMAQCETALDEARTLDEAKEALQTIHGQTRRMSGLLSQLLMLARADKGHEKLVLESVNLSELMEMTALELQEKAAKRRIRISMAIEPDIVLKADETMLLRMLMNLMENGIRYGRESGHLRVSLSRQDREAVGVIEDDGIGITEEQLPRIWERFWQADAARSGQDGSSGLGLSMVKWIIEAHGGSIRADSRYGKGSRFTFRLPV